MFRQRHHDTPGVVSFHHLTFSTYQVVVGDSPLTCNSISRGRYEVLPPEPGNFPSSLSFVNHDHYSFALKSTDATITFPRGWGVSLRRECWESQSSSFPFFLWHYYCGKCSQTSLHELFGVGNLTKDFHSPLQTLISTENLAFLDFKSFVWAFSILFLVTSSSVLSFLLVYFWCEIFSLCTFIPSSFPD